MESTDNQLRNGTVVFQILFLAFALFLLSQMGVETKYAASGGFAAQPRLWPAIGVTGMVLFGTAQIVKCWRWPIPAAAAEVFIWIRALEYLAWFMAYVAVVPVAGYLPSTVAFTVLLTVRLGYRSLLILLLAAALGAAIVIVFKTGLSVRVPGGFLYEHLPGGLRNFMILNF